MVTVHREGGFQVAIYLNGHEPAHVHVIKGDEVIVNLIGASGRPEIREGSGAPKADIREALQIITEQRDRLLSKWQEIRDGTD